MDLNSQTMDICPNFGHRVFFLAAIAALYATMSVCWSVDNEFYGSVMMFLVHLCVYYCCILDYKNIMLSYFDFLAVIAALKVTMSVPNKRYTTYIVFIRLFMLL